QNAGDLRPCERPAGLQTPARISHSAIEARRRYHLQGAGHDQEVLSAADGLVLVAGSLQALDLVNQTLLARGDTVIVEQEPYQGSLNRLTRLGVNTIGIPLDGEGMRMDVLAK